MDFLDEVLNEGQGGSWAEKNRRFLPAIIELYEEGLTLKQLAKLFRSSRSTMKNVLEAEGVERRGAGPRYLDERRIDRKAVERILRKNKITLEELEALPPARRGRPKSKE